MSGWEDRTVSLPLAEGKHRPWTVRFAPGGLAKLAAYLSAVLWSAVVWVGLVKLILALVH